MLNRKMFRDIKKNLSQFITIFLMVTIGIMVYTTMLSYSGAMQRSGDKYYKENNEKLLKKIVPVLIEGPSDKNSDLYSGYTDTMKLVNVKCDKEDLGKIINVKIKEAKSWSLNGEKVDE